jgi:type II secretory pathway component PulF
MAFGQGLVRWWPVLLLALIAAIVGAGCAMRVSQHSQLQLPLRVRRCLPQAFRRALLARLTFALADLLKTGVPLVEAVRAAAPTVGGTVGIGLRRRLLAGADRIERGEPLSAVLDDPLWFDAELRQLLAIGEKSGEIDDMLRRIGARAERQTRRLIDRLSAVLEPAVILGLAVLVGLVVMAGVLPLIRMQEVLR